MKQSTAQNIHTDILLQIAANNNDTKYCKEHTYSYITTNKNDTTYCTEITYSYINTNSSK